MKTIFTFLKNAGITVIMISLSIIAVAMTAVAIYKVVSTIANSI